MSLTDAAPAVAARAAKTASHMLATLSADERNGALTSMHEALAAGRETILAANALDLEEAEKEVAAGRLNSSLVSRLDLGRKGKWEDMLQGILDVRALPDPRELLACSGAVVLWCCGAVVLCPSSGRS